MCVDVTMLLLYRILAPTASLRRQLRDNERVEILSEWMPCCYFQVVEIFAVKYSQRGGLSDRPAIMLTQMFPRRPRLPSTFAGSVIIVHIGTSHEAACYRL